MESEPLLRDSTLGDGPAEVDERGPSASNSSKLTLLAKPQLLIVLLIFLSEPIVAFMPTPFLAQLVNETGVTGGDESQVGYYVGLIESIFFLAQGLFVLQWGRVSDKIGRRPVLLVGLFGLVASMISFSLSKSFIAIVCSRVIAGVLNGNVGVAKTMIVELTDESNRALAISLIPITWIAGITINQTLPIIVAPVIGGALQHPAERFSIFAGSAFLKKFPYFLPCFVSVAYCAITWVVAYFYLEETLGVNRVQDKHKPAEQYGSTATTPTPQSSTPSSSPAPSVATRKTGVRAVITRPVVIAVMNYGWLAILEISFWAILTVFLPVPLSAGGLDLRPPTVGLIFGALGLFDGLVQLLFFPKAYERFGPKKIMVATFVSFGAIFAWFPIAHELSLAFPSESGTLSAPVWVSLVLLLIIGGMIDMGYSVNFMFVSAAAPDPTLLGTTNGLAQMVISFVRALGPVGATSLFSASVEHRGFLGLRGYGVFVLFEVLAGIAVWCSTLLPKTAHINKDDEE